jgi:hypothetical protein
MLAYVMVGTNNVKRSAKFYDAALAPLGLVRTWSDNRSLGYSPKNAPKKSMFYVTKPYNKKPATLGNGTMISLAANSRRAVEGFMRPRSRTQAAQDERQARPVPPTAATMSPTPATPMATRSVPTAPSKIAGSGCPAPPRVRDAGDQAQRTGTA